MRRVLWATTLASLAGLATPAVADEPSLWQRGCGVVQACCDKWKGGCIDAPCGDPVIGQLICVLESHPSVCKRKKALERLDEYDWRTHPEIVSAMLCAMQSDPSPSVRREAADCLKDMHASSDEVIGAMAFSAGADHHWSVRCTAKCGVKRLDSIQPPNVTYVSSYGPALTKIESEPALDEVPKPMPRPGSEQLPRPEVKPDAKPDIKTPAPEDKPQASRSLRTLVSSAVERFRSRR